MLFERRLRQLPVGRRIAIAFAVLLVPLAVLSVVSIAVINRQESAFRESVEESIHTLLPLTTLEHYLQRALVDELEAQTDEQVPNFAALTQNIDSSFASIEGSAHDTDLPEGLVVAAQKAWRDARPSVQYLIEQTRALHPAADADGELRTRNDLQQAIQDVSAARQQLARAVEARYTQAVAARHRQLRWLVGTWAATLSVAALLIAVLLHSLLGPIRALGLAARRLGNGEAGVRAPVDGGDELAALAERFNEMAAYWESTRQNLLAVATEDALTGVLNRRGILAALEAELASPAPPSLFMVDLDHFKAINDRYGHGAGDRALVWIAAEMRMLLRQQDHIGRYGGDEFMVVLPGTGREQAQQIAQRMARSIGEKAAREAAYPALSIGVATAPEDGANATALIKAADRALYAAKGRPPAAAGGPRPA